MRIGWVIVFDDFYDFIHVLFPTVWLQIDVITMIPMTIAFVGYQLSELLGDKEDLEHNLGDIVEWYLGLLVGSIIRVFFGKII